MFCVFLKELEEKIINARLILKKLLAFLQLMTLFFFLKAFKIFKLIES